MNRLLKNPLRTQRVKVLFLLLLLIPVLAHAEDVSPQRLKELKARIDKLSDAQHHDLKQRDSLRARLEQTETRISKLVRQRRELRKKVDQARARLEKIQDHQKQLAEDQHTQLAWLARTLRAAYETGRDPRLKLLLNQQEPDRVTRILSYQRYFQQARSQRLAQLKDQLAALRKVAEQVAAARADLFNRQQALADQEKQLKQAAADRQQALASVNHSLATRSDNIDRLRDDAKHLEKMLNDVQRQSAGVAAGTSGRPFGSLEGKLPWPVDGKLLDEFHAFRGGQLRWDGVVIAAQTGTPVRAIHSGRVVYADWMRGYGLLIIVDHGGGFLTLYGYNQSLLHDVGDRVSTGDVLALAGDSGGNSQSSLYFEIRHKGKVVDPERWCSRRVTLPPLARNN